MNKKMRSKLDLKSPKQPGEVVYTQVQSTRMLNYIVTALRAIRRTVLVMTSVLVVALGIYVLVQRNENQTLTSSVDRLEKVIDRQCTQGTESRQGLRDVVSIAIGDNDGDGEPDVAKPGGLDLLKQTPQYKNLSPSDSAMWDLVLGGVLAGGGPDATPTVQERLTDYRKSLEEPSAACEPLN